MSGKKNISALLATVKNQVKTNIPDFGSGDTIRVHNRIVEGTKERIQIFEGVVIKRTKKSDHPTATFTVRKVSYNIGVERTFLLHSPRVEKIEVLTSGHVRRAKLFYLRPLRGKATRIKQKAYTGGTTEAAVEVTPAVEEVAAQ